MPLLTLTRPFWSHILVISQIAKRVTDGLLAGLQPDGDILEESTLASVAGMISKAVEEVRQTFLFDGAGLIPGYGLNSGSYSRLIKSRK